MSELRYNPMLRTWTMVGANRQGRPHLPKDWCPFCPGSGKVPDAFDVLKYDNDFPILSLEAGPPELPPSPLYKSAPATGKCEVILYSSIHQARLHELEQAHVEKLVDLWIERTSALSRDPRIRYVFPFENRGEEVGVTMPHPHGQIYAYGFVPAKVEAELASCRAHFDETGHCLVCDMNAEERRFGGRMVMENESFLAYLPFFTDYPYGVMVAPKAHRPSLLNLDGQERRDLAALLKSLTAAFDRMFERPFPYMMVFHHAPVNAPNHADCGPYTHFHIEFYPPLRAKDKIKWYAGSEMGAWAAGNVMRVEDSVLHLRRAVLDEQKAKGGDEAVASELRRVHEDLYGKGERPLVVCSPSRVNLIGEHIDYNGGLVLPAALDRATYLCARKRDDDRIIARNLNFDGAFEMRIGDALVKDAATSWFNYLSGMLDVLKGAGLSMDRGFEAVFYSDVPAGSGVSSSAAVEVGIGKALCALYGLPLDDRRIALLGQKAENEFVGVSCGIMDQFAVALSKQGHALLLNCATQETRDVPLVLHDVALVLINTNKERRLADSKYNERRAECDTALAILRQALPDLRDLCSLDEATFEQHAHLIADPSVCRRARHVVCENARVKEAVKALEAGDLLSLGRWMKASHESLRDLYEVTGEHLDALFDLAKDEPSCLGTRMTGAGFGGCTVSLVQKQGLPNFVARVSKGYEQRTGLTPAFHVCQASPGVRLLVSSVKR
ncbi:MAG: galactokinase [Myxococcota bacterium]|jgi:UDPglucose--hexose-1-phosphate uridylyltransferase|nr:galactokinase [Myxococcota bacterium]